jgi:hypothetical protein
LKTHRAKTIVSLIACLALVVLVAACDASDYSDDGVPDDIGATETAYVPDAFGENNHCYWVLDPREAVTLLASGACLHGWVAWQMPPAWHYMYFQYYSSPLYYNHYIPQDRRTYYSKTVIVQYEKAHGSDIAKYSSRAKYKKVVVKTSTKTKTTRSQGKTSTTTRTKVSSTSSTTKTITTRSSGGRGR